MRNKRFFVAGHRVETNLCQSIDEARKPVTDPEAIETILATFEQPYLLYDPT